MDLRALIRDIPDFPQPGILFRDITPLLASGPGLSRTIDELAERVAGRPVDVVAGIESRGFVFATALAVRLGVGMIPIRKMGKLPYDTFREEYQLEYGTDSVEIHTDAVRAGDQVLMVDDLLATGGTMGAACRLVQKAGGNITCCLFVIELEALRGREKLPAVPTQALLAY